ncbi:MAG: hypothetical protein J2P25_14520 [Nocardiopsaceae bacterium]|nr:hypothetical protein [Nocardiopsaceae bacterium]
MRWDRPSSGSDKPSEGNHPPQPVPPPDSSYRTRETVGESGEGTGWPKDKPKTPEVPKTPEERIKDLESRNKSLKSENARLTSNYESSLRELQRKDKELGHAKSELAKAKSDNSRLIDTNSRLVQDNMELREKTESSPAFDRKANTTGAQTEMADKKPQRKNWFPTDKVGNFGMAVAGAAGTYGVMVGRVSSKEEAFGVACAGAGLAALKLGREVSDKINAWRDKRAEKKNADR